jgi:hypothetical protein
MGWIWDPKKPIADTDTGIKKAPDPGSATLDMRPGNNESTVTGVPG